MSRPTFDITPFLHQDEGQHYDRKSLFEGPEGAKRARDRRVARDQGEGIPRMFAEMEDAFLPRPEIEVGPRGVGITLRNTPTLTAADREFVARMGSTEISYEEFRALLHAYRHARVENADLRALAGLDTLSASQLLRRLRDRSLLELHHHGAGSYYTLPEALRRKADRGEFGTDRGELAQDRGERGADRGELAPEILAAIGQLGTRPRKERLRAIIATICTQSDWTTPAELARWLNILPANLTDRHLSPMVKAGQLERRYPDTPTHAEQAYRSTGMQSPLGLSEEDEP